MKPIKKILKVNSKNFYTKHLEIINPLLPVSLTPKEIEVLGSFMSLKGDIAEKDRFGTSCRKIVKENLNLSDGGLGNYIKSLKDKGYIISKDNNWEIHPIMIIGEEDSIVYMFKIEKE